MAGKDKDRRRGRRRLRLVEAGAGVMVAGIVLLFAPALQPLGWLAIVVGAALLALHWLR